MENQKIIKEEMQVVNDNTDKVIDILGQSLIGLSKSNSCHIESAAIEIARTRAYILALNGMSENQIMQISGIPQKLKEKQKQVKECEKLIAELNAKIEELKREFETGRQICSIKIEE